MLIRLLIQSTRSHAMHPNVFTNPSCIYYRGYAQTNKQTHCFTIRAHGSSSIGLERSGTYPREILRLAVYLVSFGLCLRCDNVGADGLTGDIQGCVRGSRSLGADYCGLSLAREGQDWFPSCLRIAVSDRVLSRYAGSEYLLSQMSRLSSPDTDSARHRLVTSSQFVTVV
jgi:hypothetical protein